MKTRLAVLAVLVTLLVLPLLAITYGAPDAARHPNVGALVAEWEAPGYKSVFCSGTLIAPNVFLTAGHCTSYLQQLGIQQVWVTFDDVVTGSSTLYPGTMHTDPDFNQSMGDPADLAVVVLDTDVPLTPAHLPALGALDALHNALDPQFTVVGYGVHQSTQGGGKRQFSGPTNVRWNAIMSFSSINNTWVKMTQHGSDASGGTCYGDSGGPNFVGAEATETDVIGAITVTGDTMCKNSNVAYRLDTVSARTFLQNYVTLP